MRVTPAAKTARRHSPPARADDASPIEQAVRHLEAGKWRAAHEIVQKDASVHGSWAHGIVHLLEGDLDNAKYWYRRARRPLPEGNTIKAEIAALKASIQRSA
jgi:hypothetical protein